MKIISLQTNFVLLLIVSVCVLNASVLSNLVLAALVFTLFVLNFNSVRLYFWHKVAFLLTVSLAILIGTTLYGTDVTLIREARFSNSVDLARVIIFVTLMFSFPYRIQFGNQHYIILFFVAMYLFIMQVLLALNMGAIESFIDDWYSHRKNSWGSPKLESLGDFKTKRYAGIFRNPNIMGQMMVLLYCCLARYVKERGYFLPIFSLFFISVLITGGRTAAITLFVLGFFSAKQSLHFYSKFILVCLGIILLIMTIYIDFSGFSFRALSIKEEGFMGGIQDRIGYLTNWLVTDIHLSSLLFGRATTDTFFDAELGYILEMYGVVGITILLLFFKRIYANTQREYRYLFFIFLISIAATVLINFRFSMLLFIILSMYNIRDTSSNKYGVTVLIDSVYINNSGGKALLDYLVDKIEQKKVEAFYLFDDRCRESFANIPDQRKTFIKNSMISRYRFYVQNRKRFDKILCFANIPPLLKSKNAVTATYFHNTLILDLSAVCSFAKRLRVLAQKMVILFFKRNADYWFVQSDNMKKMMARQLNISDRKIKVIPFYTLDNRPVSGKNIKINSFIYPSTGFSYKNHPCLLKAWEALYEKGHNPVLHLTLSDMNSALKSQYLRLKNKGINIVNHGQITSDALRKLYLEAEYLVYPSLAESFGLPLIEAIHFGCKVVAADLDYVHAVIQPSFVFDPTDVGSIAKAVEMCLDGRVQKESKCLVENKIDDLIDFI